jgi:hypothetical protein
MSYFPCRASLPPGSERFSVTEGIGHGKPILSRTRKAIRQHPLLPRLGWSEFAGLQYAERRFSPPKFEKRFVFSEKHFGTGRGGRDQEFLVVRVAALRKLPYGFSTFH